MPTDYRTAHLDIEARDNARDDALALQEAIEDRAAFDAETDAQWADVAAGAQFDRDLLAFTSLGA
jgi:hypothetical protein